VWENAGGDEHTILGQMHLNPKFHKEKTSRNTPNLRREIKKVI
jgi:hypothetical protein